MVIPSYRFILFTSSPAATTSSSSFTCSPLPTAEWITKVPVRFYVATRTMRFHYVSRPSLRRVETLLIHGVPPRITFQRVDSARYLQPIFLRRKFSKETICRNLLSFSFFFYTFSFSTFFVFLSSPCSLLRTHSDSISLWRFSSFFFFFFWRKGEGISLLTTIGSPDIIENFLGALPKKLVGQSVLYVITVRD